MKTRRRSTDVGAVEQAGASVLERERVPNSTRKVGVSTASLAIDIEMRMDGKCMLAEVGVVVILVGSGGSGSKRRCQV